ncbi:MAG: WG repeat-containing protein [Flavobacteriaceae bacterium]|jgi:hypothetical protein|nr:WG repeat-containing protein [Flavobacteriaceae bacterium]
MRRVIITLGISALALCSYAQELALFKDKGKVGFIDKKGSIVITPIFDAANSFNDGLAAVSNGNKWGFIDHSGSWVIQPVYDKAKDFNYGVALVLSDKEWHYINKEGIFIEKIDKAYGFKAGVAFYKIEDKVGLLDNQGEVIITPTYDKIVYLNDTYFKASLNGKWGVVDNSGKVLIPFEYDSVSDYVDGVSCVKEEKDYYVWNNGKKIKLDGVTKIVSLVDIEYIIAKKEKLTGMINSLGEEVISFKYENLGMLSQGLIPARLNGRWGYINTKEEEVIKFKYDYVLSFNEEGIAAARYNKKWGFINKEDEVIIPFKYDINANNYAYRKRGQGFVDGLARVKYKNKWGFIDVKGNVLGNRWYNNVELFSK